MALIAPINASRGLDVGAPPSTARDDSIGRGLRAFGGAVEQAGIDGLEIVNQMAARDQTRKRFSATMQKRELDARLEAEIATMQASMDPTGAGYLDTVNKHVTEQYQGFRRGLEPWLQEEFGPELDASAAVWRTGAVKTQVAQEQAWYGQGVDAMIDAAANDVFNNPSLLSAALADVEAEIGASGLYRINADEKLRIARERLQTQLVERAIRDGDVSKLPMLGIASPGNAAAAALIRGFEGMRTSAYPDTRTSTGQFDAWRVGYGSDTITLSDGTVQRVTAQTRVRPEDAERDLQRRIVEFEKTIIGQVGIDQWAALPASARAGLTSVAYNYGRLPKSVVGAVKGGDVQAIASAVAALDANPDRRRREAAAILGGAEPAADVADIPFDIRRQLHDRLLATGKASVETAVLNAPPAITNTGTYTGPMPTAEQFVASYGPQEGADRYRAFEASIDIAETAHAMRTMPAAEIAALLEANRPKSSGADAALETERFDLLQKSATAALAARNEDPATYTRQAFPEVKQAWERYQRPDLPPEERPTAYADALAKTMSAQQSLGVAKPVLLPGTVVDQALASWKDKTATEEARIGPAIGLLTGTRDRAQQMAIWEQLVGAGMPEQTAGAFDAMARGDHAAAQRLFTAALFDASALPGKSPETPARISEAIQSGLMMPGAVGDVFYGLSDGDASNLERAAMDAKLITNAVELRVRQGESLDAAVQAVGRDMFGSVVPVRGQNVSVLVNEEVDAGSVQTGFRELLPQVRVALNAASAVPADLPTADSSKAIFAAAEANQREAILSDGYFRNSGDGFVFIDPFDGVAVEGLDGLPLTFTLEQVLAAANAAPPAARDPLFDEAEQALAQELERQRLQSQLSGGAP